MTTTPTTDPSSLLASLRSASSDFTAPAAQSVEESDELVRLSKILIVDDEAYNIQVFKKHLQLAGYRHFVTTSDSRQALGLLRRESADLVLLDIMMPNVNGLEILEQIRAQREFRHLPVIILTASTDRAVMQRALELGANDYLNKPIDYEGLTLRVRNALLMKNFHDRLTRHAELLEETVQKRTNELAASHEEIIRCLARAGEYRDDQTGNHAIRVGKYVALIADEMQFAEDRIRLLDQAAQLHDLGKIAIPDQILQRPGRLSEDEFALMTEHCVIGREILEPYEAREAEVVARHAEFGAELMSARATPLLKVAALISLTHHERWDGSGYPLGLAGNDIPIEGRMTAVADVFDALASKRPYKDPYPSERCFEILAAERGSHFDPEIVDAFSRRKDEVIQIQIDYAGSCAGSREGIRDKEQASL